LPRRLASTQLFPEVKTSLLFRAKKLKRFAGLQERTPELSRIHFFVMVIRFASFAARLLIRP
jgi:hypothetical protein